MADFSSVCTGSSPVVRYRLLYPKANHKHNVWTYSLMISTSVSWWMCDVFCEQFSRIVWRNTTSKQKLRIHKKWILSILIHRKYYMILTNVWCNRYADSDRCGIISRNTTNTIDSMWADGRAVNYCGL